MSRSQRPLPTIATLMTPFPQSVPPSATIADAQSAMDDGGFRHLPVVQGGKVIGLLSSRDLDVARLLIALEDGDEDVPPTEVGTLCTRPVLTVDIHASLAGTLRTMADKHFGSAIVQREGKLAGIITNVDICRAFAALIDPPTDDDDQAA